MFLLTRSMDLLAIFLFTLLLIHYYFFQGIKPKVLYLENNAVYKNAENQTELLHCLIEVDPQKSKWENTTLSFGFNFLFLPTGVGVNICFQPDGSSIPIKIPTEPGYAVVNLN